MNKFAKLITIVLLLSCSRFSFAKESNFYEPEEKRVILARKALDTNQLFFYQCSFSHQFTKDILSELHNTKTVNHLNLINNLFLTKTV